MNLKRSKFAIALFASLTLAGSSAAQACDKCQPACTKCKSSVACDDQGLLSVFDRFAGRIQTGVKASLPKMNLPKLGNKCSGKHSGSSSCDAGPSCGCESHAASCGCESHDATNDHGGSESLPPMQAEPQQPHMHSEYPIHTRVRPRSQPIERFESNAPPQAPKYRDSAPTLQAPKSLPGPLPIPDSTVDPFMDEASNRIRQIPARTIQYSKPSNRYRESYDPQAFNSYRVRLSDDNPAVAEPTRDHSEFRTADSSRRAADAPATIAGREVVTASARQAAQPAPITLRPVQRLLAPDAVEPYYANPLRSNK